MIFQKLSHWSSYYLAEKSHISYMLGCATTKSSIMQKAVCKFPLKKKSRYHLHDKLLQDKNLSWLPKCLILLSLICPSVYNRMKMKDLWLIVPGSRANFLILPKKKIHFKLLNLRENNIMSNNKVLLMSLLSYKVSWLLFLSKFSSEKFYRLS